MRSAARVVTFFLVGGLLTATAWATQVIRLALPDLVTRAEVIVEGRCLSLATRQDARGALETEVLLAVDRGRKGARDGDLLRFRMPGGELNGRRLSIPGLPMFQPGDEVLLFLTPPSARGWVMPVGLGQGVYRMSRDPASGAPRLETDLTGVELVDAATGQIVPGPPRQGVAYRALVDEIERLLGDDR